MIIEKPVEGMLEELKVKLNEALQALPHTHRMAVILNDLEGLPKKEIAEILNCSEKKVISFLSEAHQRLQKALDASDHPLLQNQRYEISDLMRLKKLETPGPEYFEHFLPEFHRYQRASILDQPNRWSEFFDSLSGFVFAIPRPVAAMATAMAVFAIVAVMHPLSTSVDTEPTFVSVPQMDTVVEDAFSMDKKNFVDVSASYTDALTQQPELQKEIPLAEEQHDMSTPRYITGNTASSYDTTLAF